MGKHTPRPWQVTRVDYPDKQDVSFEIRGALHRGIFPVICQTFMRELKSEWHLIEQDEANMALIAAAPDLLEACKRARDRMFQYGESREELDELDAVIAKAEGRSAEIPKAPEE